MMTLQKPKRTPIKFTNKHACHTNPLSQRNKIRPNLNLKHKTQYDAIFNTFSINVAKHEHDIFSSAPHNTELQSQPSKGRLVHVGLLLFFSWVLTSYVFCSSPGLVQSEWVNGLYVVTTSKFLGGRHWPRTQDKCAS